MSFYWLQIWVFSIDRCLGNDPNERLDKFNVLCRLLYLVWSENTGRKLLFNLLLARNDLSVGIAAFLVSIPASLHDIREVQRLVVLSCLALTLWLKIIGATHHLLPYHFFLFTRLTNAIRRMGVDCFLGKLSDIFWIWFVLLNNNLPLGLKLSKSAVKQISFSCEILRWPLRALASLLAISS